MLQMDMLRLHMHIIIGFWVAVSKIFGIFIPQKKGGNDPNLMTIFFQFGGLNHQATSLGLLQPPHDMARIQKQLAD